MTLMDNTMQQEAFFATIIQLQLSTAINSVHLFLSLYFA